jgi:site-specific recombinase XerD
MHRLRATFATLHLRKGTPLKEVQEMMGHGDARTTLLYQEGSQGEKRKYQDALWA